MMFNELVNARCSKIRTTLNKKAKEYATDDDRFHNFNKAGQMLGSTPEKALWGFLMKHIVSVSDMVEHPEIVTKELIDEKIGDCVNYFILLEGLLQQVGTEQDE
jgi:hypothetical protein